MKFEHLFTANITVSDPIEVGDTGAGFRRMIPITGGTFEGPNMKGIIVPGGADYQLIRHDGVTELIAQYVIQTDDGVSIYVVNKGYRHGPKEIMDRLIRGESVPDGSYYFKSTPTFEVAGEKYDFLNKTIYMGEGIRRPSDLEIVFYEVQ